MSHFGGAKINKISLQQNYSKKNISFCLIINEFNANLLLIDSKLKHLF